MKKPQGSEPEWTLVEIMKLFSYSFMRSTVSDEGKVPNDDTDVSTCRSDEVDHVV